MTAVARTAAMAAVIFDRFDIRNDDIPEEMAIRPRHDEPTDPNPY
jgi:hypothetical protein